MKKIIGFLKAPCYPISRKWKMVAIPPLIVFMVLSLLQPFTFSAMGYHKYILFLGYAGTTAISTIFIVFLLPYIIPSLFNPEKFNVWKNIVINILIALSIAISNIAFHSIYWNNIPDYGIMRSFLGYTIMVGIFPCIVVEILKKNQDLKNSVIELREIRKENTNNSQNNITENPETDYSTIVLGTNIRDRVELSPLQLAYIEADGNYVNIFFIHENRLVKKNFRSTIKQFEELTADYPFMIKTHRAFIVNINLVKRITGNSQGYKLELKIGDDEIPVSRAFSKSIKEYLT